MAKKKHTPLDTPLIEREVHRSHLSEKVLHAALEQVTTKHDEHGDTVNSFTMISELWTTYVQHVAITRNAILLEPQDVAKMMVLMKVSRSVYGKAGDNYVDSAGYSALASMLEPDNANEE